MNNQLPFPPRDLVYGIVMARSEQIQRGGSDEKLEDSPEYKKFMQEYEMKQKRKAKTKEIAPLDEIFAVVKVRHCKEHLQKTVQGAYGNQNIADIIAKGMSPFATCGLCEYEVRKYKLVKE